MHFSETSTKTGTQISPYLRAKHQAYDNLTCKKRLTREAGEIIDNLTITTKKRIYCVQIAHKELRNNMYNKNNWDNKRANVPKFLRPADITSIVYATD
jgi:hypothetical protein